MLSLFVLPLEKEIELMFLVLILDHEIPSLSSHQQQSDPYKKGNKSISDTIDTICSKRDNLKN